MDTVSSDTRETATENIPVQGLPGSGVPPLLFHALGDGTAAFVLWTLRGWLIHNETHNISANYRDGRWWTYSSLEKWCARDFPWLTPRKLGTIMTKLLKLNLIVRQQHQANEFRMSYWYSVNEDVLTRLMEDKKRANASDKNVKCIQQIRVDPSDKNVQCKTVVKEKNLKLKEKPEEKKLQTTTETVQDADVILKTTSETNVVDDPLPRPTPEYESGEHSIDGEGHDATAVKAHAQNELHHDEEPISKVPEKVLSPLVVEVLSSVDMLPAFSEPLIERYGEGRVREVLAHIQQSTSFHTPAGFLVKALRDNIDVSVGSRGMQKDVQTTPAPKRFIPPGDFVCTDEEREEIGLIGFDRFIALRHENERIAEQSALDPEYA
jgi:hypothetical protein